MNHGDLRTPRTSVVGVCQAFVTPTSFRQMLGTFTHNVLQQINESIKRKEEITPAEMSAIVDRHWVDLPMSKEKNKREKEMLLRKLVTYYLSAIDNFSDIIAIEQSFSHIGDNMILKGKVDLIAKDRKGGVCLIDFKARRQKGIEETNVDKQLRIYDHCLDTEIKVDKLLAYTVEDNQVTEFAPDRKGTEQFLHEIGRKMAAEEYPKQKNTFCRQCQFKFYCWGTSDKV